VQRIYWTKNIKKGVPFSNASGYSNPEMDAVIEASQVEHDRRKRKDLIARLQAIAAEDMPVLDLFEIRFFTLANRKVRDHTDSAEGVYGSFKNTWLQK
jgi:peptide/nickel transport system substrate-binding protein